MTVVNPDSIAGITSVTSSGTTLEFYDVNGNLLDVSANLTGQLTVGTGATINSPATNAIDFETNGVERLRITSGGKLGLGETSPDFKFHSKETGGSSIAGLFETNQTDAYISFQASGTTASSTVRIGAVGDNFQAFINGAERLRIASDGKVGIATDAPQGTLDVRGSIYITDHNNGINFSNPTNKVEYHQLYLTSSDNSLQLKTAGGAWKSTIHIEDTGRIGIGTDAPGTRDANGSVDIVQNHANTGPHFRVLNKHATLGGGIQFKNNNNNGGIEFLNKDGSNTGAFYNSTGGWTWNETLQLAAGKLLRIGRTSGSFALDVQTASDSTFRISNSGETGHGSHDAKIVAGGSYYQNPNIVGSAIKFSTYNGSSEGERARITSAGFVGINETSPDNALHIKSGTDTQQIKLENTVSTGRAQIRYLNPQADWQQGIIGGTTDGDFITWTSAAKKIRFYTNSTERLRITSGGDVHMGNSGDPSFASVAGNTAGGLEIHNVGNDTAACLKLSGNNNTGGSPGQETYTQLEHRGGNLTFNINHNGSERFKIEPTGNIRIFDHLCVDKAFETLTGNGVNAKLQVNCGSNDYDGIMIGGGYNRSTITTGGNYDLVYTSNAYPANATSYGHRFLCGSNGGGGPNQRLRIHSTGDIQFGDNPTSTLWSATNNAGTYYRKDQGSLASATRANTGYSSYYINKNTGAGGSEDRRWIDFYWNTNHYGRIEYNGASGTNYNTGSDYRLKENVVSITDGIEKVKQLKPYRFNFKSDTTDKVVQGFFAHEAQDVVPYAVSGTKDEVVTQAAVDEGSQPEDRAVGDPIYQNVDYAKFTPILTAALKEAIAKIETLESKVESIQAQQANDAAYEVKIDKLIDYFKL